MHQSPLTPFPAPSTRRRQQWNFKPFPHQQPKWIVVPAAYDWLGFLLFSFWGFLRKPRVAHHAIMRCVWEAGIAVVLVLGGLPSSASAISDCIPTFCGKESVAESVLGFRDNYCPLHGLGDSVKFVRVTEVAHFSFFAWFKRTCSLKFPIVCVVWKCVYIQILFKLQGKDFTLILLLTKFLTQMTSFGLPVDVTLQSK